MQSPVRRCLFVSYKSIFILSFAAYFQSLKSIESPLFAIHLFKNNLQWVSILLGRAARLSPSYYFCQSKTILVSVSSYESTLDPKCYTRSTSMRSQETAAQSVRGRLRKRASSIDGWLSQHHLRPRGDRLAAISHLHALISSFTCPISTHLALLYPLQTPFLLITQQRSSFLCNEVRKSLNTFRTNIALA